MLLTSRAARRLRVLELVRRVVLLPCCAALRLRVLELRHAPAGCCHHS